MNPLASIPVRTSVYLTETKFVQYRPDRFIEYEPTDSPLVREGWAEFRQVPSPTVYQINGYFVMHPETWEAVKKQIPEVESVRKRTDR